MLLFYVNIYVILPKVIFKISVLPLVILHRKTFTRPRLGEFVLEILSN